MGILDKYSLHSRCQRCFLDLAIRICEDNCADVVNHQIEEEIGKVWLESQPTLGSSKSTQSIKYNAPQG